ncbi:MAG: 2-oxoacid:acceptor oxidoreductase family protein [Phycisphaerae bacterium]|nr:2-oxoacid:acceptor oxidoreductase family protein [Phycisphaerae bacterium]
MAITEIRTGGLGGQGVILAGMIVGRAASIYAGKHATLTQSFGPEARGSACGASLVISDEPVEYPYVTCPDTLLVMSQEACNRFAPEMASGGILLYEADLVKPGNLPKGVKAYGVPATRIAENLNRRMVANIVIIGFFASITDIISSDALRQSVEASVPPGTEHLNLTAFDQGYEYGQAIKDGKTPSLGGVPA